MPGLSDSFFVPCIPTKTVNLRNGNFREFFRWWGEFCHFKTGILGGPGANIRKRAYLLTSRPRPTVVIVTVSPSFTCVIYCVKLLLAPANWRQCACTWPKVYTENTDKTIREKVATMA